MEKKYELTNDYKINENGKKVYRIRAIKDFLSVKTGELGGFIEREDNLSQYDNAWVSGDAWVYDNAQVYGNAWVSGDAEVYGDAQVYGNAWVSGDAEVYGDAEVSGDAWVYDNARVSGNAQVSGNADYAMVKGFGRKYRNTTFFRCKDGKIRVVCGCFFGDLDEFREKVKKTHGDDKMAREYLAIADLMKMHFE